MTEWHELPEDQSVVAAVLNDSGYWVIKPFSAIRKGDKFKLFRQQGWDGEPCRRDFYAIATEDAHRNTDTEGWGLLADWQYGFA